MQSWQYLQIKGLDSLSYLNFVMQMAASFMNKTSNMEFTFMFIMSHHIMWQRHGMAQKLTLAGGKFDSLRGQSSSWWSSQQLSWLLFCSWHDSHLQNKNWHYSWLQKKIKKFQKTYGPLNLFEFFWFFWFSTWPKWSTRSSQPMI